MQSLDLLIFVYMSNFYNFRIIQVKLILMGTQFS